MVQLLEIESEVEVNRALGRIAPTISVVVPVHNGEWRIPALFDALLAQKTPGMSWEVIAVDNASTDDTASVFQRFRDGWRRDGSFRTVHEPRKGLAYARQRGVDEARGEWVAFLDDDTRPDDDWIAAAVEFGRSHPRAGVYGGRIRLEVPGGAPTGFSRLGVYFCERDLGEVPREYRSEILEMPPGAGLVVRRDAWQQCVPRELRFPHLGGNDLEAGLHIQLGGWEIWYAPTMLLVHEVDPRRLSREHLGKMMRIYGRQSCSLRLIGKRGWRRWETRIRMFFGGLYRMLRLVAVEGRGVFRNPFVRADLIFWRSNFLSSLSPEPVGAHRPDRPSPSTTAPSPHARV